MLFSQFLKNLGFELADEADRGMLLRNVALRFSINWCNKDMYVELTQSNSHDNNKGDWSELTNSVVYKQLSDGRCDEGYSCMKHKLWISEDNKRRLVKIKIDEYRLRLMIERCGQWLHITACMDKHKTH